MITIKQISSFCQIGPRSNQEDCIAPEHPATDNRVFVLCDGMGGHGHGEVASLTTATTAEEYLRKLNAPEFTGEDLQAAADLAVDAMSVCNTFNDLRIMGTTAVIVAVNRMRLVAGHAGDSRIYLFGADGSIKFRSRDHSQVAEAVENELLTEEEARVSPYRNIITRALKADGRHVELEIDELVVADNDILLLCSDGVTDAMTDRDLKELFAAFDFEEACARLAARCNTMSNDNNTAIIMQLGQDESYIPLQKESTADNAPVDESTDGNDGNASATADEQPRMNYCTTCGARLPEQAHFCPGCGVKLNAHSPSIEEIATDAGRTLRNGLDKALGFAEKGIKTLRRHISNNTENQD